jgi:hypothetical protein
MNGSEQKVTKKKFFGVSNPIGKAIIYIVFIVLTGGLGLIALLLAALGDRFLSKRKSRSKSGARKKELVR